MISPFRNKKRNPKELAAAQVKGFFDCICLPMQETWVQCLSHEDPLKKEITTDPSILAWGIPWTVEPGGLQSIG